MVDVLEKRIELGKARAKEVKSVGVVGKDRMAYDFQGNCLGPVRGGFVLPKSLGRITSWQDLVPLYVVRNRKIYEISGNEHIDY